MDRADEVYEKRRGQIEALIEYVALFQQGIPPLMPERRC